MTFRPSDDVLDEIANGQQPSSSLDQYDVSNQGDWQHIFNNSESVGEVGASWDDTVNPLLKDLSIEEVKSPDLSDLLKDDWNNSNNNVLSQETENISEVKNESVESSSVNVNINNNLVESDNSVNAWWATADVVSKNTVEENKNIDVVNETSNAVDQNFEAELEGVNLWDMTDKERFESVSLMDGATDSNLNFLVDKGRFATIEKYKKIHRLFFRWWIFTLALLLGIVSWVLLQVKANVPQSVEMIKKNSITNVNLWNDKLSDDILSPLVDSGVQIEVIIPYGSATVNWKTFQSKSNLMKYKWLILPELSHIKYDNQKFVSLEDFDNGKLVREDIENLIRFLITDDLIYTRTTNLPNVFDSRWNWNVFKEWLIKGFSLWCISNNKVSDFVCDKFLKSFFDNGKYYDLSKYAQEISTLVKELKVQWKDIKPICTMIDDYTLRAGVVSDTLSSIMENCWIDEYSDYRKMLNFISVENSLWQPELSNEIFEDPDLNAYKLLSAQQNVYKILDGTSLNENYIKSYLTFVQTLINRDDGNNKYLNPIYKDLLYVFNMDNLYMNLMERWKLTVDLKLQIDQINNWNTLYGYPALTSQLTTPNLINTSSSFTGTKSSSKDLDEIFSQYYAMTDRLKIRSAVPISEDKIRVQTELFTEKILEATGWKTLKLTVILRRKDNVLYVDSIQVANQQKFTEILSIYAEQWWASFYEMLNYIDEQVGMRYNQREQSSWGTSYICGEIQWIEDVAVYSCDNSSILLYKWDVEYDFVLFDGALDNFTISDENIDSLVKDKLKWKMFTKDDTAAVIKSIVEFDVSLWDANLEKKLDIIDQFRIHFKLIPTDVIDVEWQFDTFFVTFTLWGIDLQAYYDVNTHLLTKISFVNCDKTLEIRNLSIEVSVENEKQLTEILNNPKVFFARANPSAYKKYQKMCEN